MYCAVWFATVKVYFYASEICHWNVTGVWLHRLFAHWLQSYSTTSFSVHSAGCLLKVFTFTAAWRTSATSIMGQWDFTTSLAMVRFSCFPLGMLIVLYVLFMEEKVFRCSAKILWHRQHTKSNTAKDFLSVCPSVTYPACKNWVVRCWRGYLSRARCRVAYGAADATATHCLLLQ